MGPIMAIAHDVIAIGSQSQIYNEELISEILKDIHKNFCDQNQHFFSV